jgi:hypothetical protein
METIEEIIQDYTREAEIDIVALAQLASRFSFNQKITSDAEVKKKSLQVARGLIANGVCPGYMKADLGFNFWQGTSDELLARISASWPTVGIPTLASDHCWFAKRADYDAEGNLIHRPPRSAAVLTDSSYRD